MQVQAEDLATQPTTTVVDTRSGPGFLIRALWFVFIGWWASFLLINLAVVVSFTVIGIPLAIWLMNRIPQVVTLKLDKTRTTTTLGADGSTHVTISGIPQRPFWQRALWYLLVGWWATTASLYLAWLLSITIIGMPLAFPIFSATGKILTLKRG